MFRIDWKKLVFIGAILTVFRIMFQISTLPYPLTEWILFPPSEISSSRYLNHEKNLRELPASQDMRFNLSQHAPLVVSLNSTDRLNETQQVLERRQQVSRQQKSRKHVDAVDKVIFPSSPVRNKSNNMLVSFSLCLYSLRILLNSFALWLSFFSLYQFSRDT